MSDKNEKNMQKYQIPCAVYEDLLQLVTDGIASEESRILVDQHAKNCPHCSQNERIEVVELEISSETRILQKIKFQVMAWGFVLLLFGVFFGVSMGVSEEMFLNIWIMPLLGGLSALIYKNRSVYLLVAVFLISSIFHCLPFHFVEDYSIYNLLGGLQYGMVYAGLFLLGQVIGALFGFALKKEVE